MREKLIELLNKYFDIGDSYAYNLTRVKTAFEVGTMSLEDFVEFDEETITNLADYLIKSGVTIPVICKNCAHSDYYEGKLICYKYTEYMVDEIRFLEVAPDGFCDDGKWREDE